MSADTNLIDAVGEEANAAISEVIRKLLDDVPRAEQVELDTLRAIHQVLAYHLGTVGRLIEGRFLAAGDVGVTERLRAERDDMIARGVEHANHHVRAYQH